MLPATASQAIKAFHWANEVPHVLLQRSGQCPSRRVLLTEASPAPSPPHPPPRSLPHTWGAVKPQRAHKKRRRGEKPTLNECVWLVSSQSPSAPRAQPGGEHLQQRKIPQEPPSSFQRVAANPIAFKLQEHSQHRILGSTSSAHPPVLCGLPANIKNPLPP